MIGDSFGGVLGAAGLGEEWAVAALWRDLHPPLVRYLRVVVGESGAEDVASDVWMEVADGLARFSGDEQALRRWVFTIARFRAIDDRRASLRRRTDRVAPDDLAAVSLRTPGADSEVEQRLALDAALRRIAMLPRDQAEVVLLRVVAGLGVDEVARIMHKRAGTVRVLHHRALRRLAVELEKEGVTPQARETLLEIDEPLTV